MDRRQNWRMALPPVVAIIFAALAFLQVPGINGPRYWKWHWHRNANPFGVAAALGVAALPALAAQVVRERAPERRRLMAALLILSSVALPVTGSALHAGRTSAGWIRAVMLDPSVTGYIRSAEEIIEFEQRRHDVDWLRVYDKIMTYFPLHARTKPLGMVTAHYLSVRAFGANATIFVAAAIFLNCAVASVLMILVAFRWMGFSVNVTIDAATLLVLAPSM